MASVDKPYKCTECKSQFSFPNGLKVHMRKHFGDYPFGCDVCGQRFYDSSWLKVHKRTHSGEKPYACEFCSKRFTQPAHLVSHRRIHTKEKPYKCDICDRTFAHSSALKVHRRKHTGERPYSCEVCLKTFSEHCHLARHKLTHSGVKPFKCNECGKTFTQIGNLSKHQLLHTENKPHICHECGLKFREKASLLSHMKQHTGEKQYCCGHCGKEFIHKSSLVLHSRVHSGEKPFRCDICDKQFTQSTHKKTHMKAVHFGEKPHHCEVCSRNFKSSHSLKTHSRIHTGDQPYHCAECNKYFAHSSSFCHHNKIHHSNNLNDINIKEAKSSKDNATVKNLDRKGDNQTAYKGDSQTVKGDNPISDKGDNRTIKPQGLIKDCDIKGDNTMLSRKVDTCTNRHNEKGLVLIGEEESRPEASKNETHVNEIETKKYVTHIELNGHYNGVVDVQQIKQEVLSSLGLELEQDSFNADDTQPFQDGINSLSIRNKLSANCISMKSKVLNKEKLEKTSNKIKNGKNSVFITSTGCNQDKLKEILSETQTLGEIDVIYNCDLCGFYSYNKSALTDHLKFHENLVLDSHDINGNQPFVSNCEQSYTYIL